MTRTLLLLLPGGSLIYAAVLLLRCRHRNEVLCMRAEGMGLRCVACGRARPHPWSGEPQRYKRTQERGEPSGNSGELTGIERAALEAEAEAAERRRVFVVYEGDRGEGDRWQAEGVGQLPGGSAR